MQQKTYRQLRDELDAILQELETGELDIEEALVLHKQGQDLLKQMGRYLEKAGQTIKPKKSS